MVQVAVYHFCLGSLMYGLMASGHPTVVDLVDSIAVRWIQQLSGQSSTNEVFLDDITEYNGNGAQV